MVLDYGPKSTPKIFNSNKTASSCTQQARNAAECRRNARRVTTECRGMSRNAGDSCGMQSGLWRITKFTITEPLRNGGLELAEVAIVWGEGGELMWCICGVLPAPAFRNIPWSTWLLNVCPGSTSANNHKATMPAECCGMYALASLQQTTIKPQCPQNPRNAAECVPCQHCGQESMEPRWMQHAAERAPWQQFSTSA